MARFLFVVPPLTGHINPTVSVARELSALGHEVAWVGHARALAPRLPRDAHILALEDDMPAEAYAERAARAQTLRGATALKFLWEEFFIPLARSMRPGVEDAVGSFGPDVLIVDQQALAGALVARQRALAWATLVTTSASILDPLADLPKVREWRDELIAGLMRESGLHPSADCDLSPHLVVAFTTEALLDHGAHFPNHYRFVGPSISARPESVPFPWEALDKAPKVLVSLGTVNGDAGARFYREIIAALGGLAMQVILVAPAALLPESLPSNFLVRDYVPQLALLQHLDAVVCHAGHNTVAESLAHGVPLVVAPIKDDQPIVAKQVVEAGAGIRVKFGRARAPMLRQAVQRVLSEATFRTAAARVRDSFAAAGGAARAANLLEALS